jgi:FdhD protein
VSAGIQSINIQRVQSDEIHSVEDAVSVEEPLEIRLLHGEIGHPVSVTMRTPDHDAELALGFLFGEGILQGAQEVERVTQPETNVLDVHIKPDVVINLTSLSRNFYTTSSCGVCGKTSLDAIRIRVKPNTSDFAIRREVLTKSLVRARQAQTSFETTGGVHASSLFDKHGNLILTREDVGRHNALDKVIGALFQDDRLPASKTFLLVSGRASFELVQKAAVAGIPVVAAIGAPSSLAIELAKESGICLIGFLKVERFNIYSHPQRILT